METFISTSREETFEIAGKLASDLKTGGVVVLRGDLASGKTTFVQGIGNFFGINRLTSPTFNIMREYQVTTHPVIKNLCHLDLYRLNSEEDLHALSLPELISDTTNLVLIEWPERLKTSLPSMLAEVTLKSVTENERLITIHKT